MTKKKYVKPEVISTIVVCESIIAVSEPAIKDGPSASMSGQARGGWGNLWSK